MVMRVMVMVMPINGWENERQYQEEVLCPPLLERLCQVRGHHRPVHWRDLQVGDEDDDGDEDDNDEGGGDDDDEDDNDDDVAYNVDKAMTSFRFLLQSPRSPAEKEHSIRMM